MKKLLSSKNIAIVSLLAAQSLIGSSATAGVKAPISAVSAESTFMFGCLGDARNSANSNESVSITDTGSTMYFGARNASGITKICATTNETHKTQLRSANSDACFWVDYSSATSTCTNVKVYNDSQRQPKAQ